MKQALTMGRYQLVGNQHVDLYDQIIDFNFNTEKIEKLNVGIGVADYVNFSNMFSGTECLNMIKPVAEKAAQKMGIPVEFRLVPDINNNNEYANHVSNYFGLRPATLDEVIVFSSNPNTNVCFENRLGYRVENIIERINQHSTDLRNKYVHGRDISNKVPNHIINFLKDHNALERMINIKYKNPTPTVDIIARNEEGKYCMIWRAENPIGYAWPGGHLEVGESAEECGKREYKEETNLDVEIEGLVGVYSDPKRDSREHKISVCYYGTCSGTPKPQTDAKSIHFFEAHEIPKMEFDHNEMFEDYLVKVERKILEYN